MPSLKELVQPSIQTVVNSIEYNKLMLIHPSSRYRTLIISALIDDPPCPLFYYGLGFEDVSLDAFLTGLVRDLSDQMPTFGKHTSMARQQSPGNIDVLAEAFAADLAELSSDHYLLILDDYDRADEVAEVQTFAERLLDYLPDQCHLLINSRSLPRLPWVALVARAQAVVLRDARMLTSGFYSESFQQNPNIEVFALGSGYVMINGVQVNTWEGYLPRLLFFFVLDRPMVTRAEICESFWPNLPIDQAVNVFHVTKRRLHKALGFDVLVHEGGHYQVNPDINLKYDVLEFVKFLVEARAASGAEAEELWLDAVETYRGEFLQGHTDEWVIKRRGDFKVGYLQALIRLAEISRDKGELEYALGYYLKSVAEAPNREDLHRHVLQLYHDLGRRGEAAEHYSYLRNLLDSEYNIAPSPETQDLYQAIVSE